jgi:hypothetical protein
VGKPKSEPKAEAPPKREPQRPVHQVRLGRIVCKVWENQHPEGTWYSTTISRLYRANDQWRSSNSYGRDDLLLVAECARQAMHWIYRQQQNQNSSTAGDAQEAAHETPADEIPF